MIIGNVTFESGANSGSISFAELREMLPTHDVETERSHESTSLTALKLLALPYPATLQIECSPQGQMRRVRWDVDNTALMLLDQLSAFFKKQGWKETREGGPFEIGEENDGLPF